MQALPSEGELACSSRGTRRSCGTTSSSRRRERPAPEARLLIEAIESLPEGEFGRLQESANAALINLGITFNVYSDGAGIERVLPFDIVPRVVRAREWDRIEAGLKQRIRALNLFLDDVYHEGRILKDGVVPPELVLGAPSYREQCRDLDPPMGIWCHITGTDLVRDGNGEFYVLEDNLRCPSGVSYVLENRRLMKNTFPSLFASSTVRPVDDYPSQLLEVLQYISGQGQEASAAVLTPGMYNSAYFEHSYLSQQMGVELVEGGDLVVVNDVLYMRTTAGLERVDVLYRRVDDDFIDPEVFREDSMLGVPGLMRAYRAGQPGAGERAGHRHRRRQGDLRLRAGDHSLLPGRGRHPAQRADLPVLAAVRSAVRAGAPRRARREAGERVRRLRPARGAARDGSRAGRVSPPHRRTTRATTSLSLRWRSRGRPWSSKTTSRAVTSTCGLTSSTARTSTCCRAA